MIILAETVMHIFLLPLSVLLSESHGMIFGSNEHM